MKHKILNKSNHIFLLVLISFISCFDSVYAVCTDGDGYGTLPNVGNSIVTHSTILDNKYGVANADDCAKHCHNYNGCNAFRYNAENKFPLTANCVLYQAHHPYYSNQGGYDASWCEYLCTGGQTCNDTMQQAPCPYGTLPNGQCAACKWVTGSNMGCGGSTPYCLRFGENDIRCTHCISENKDVDTGCTNTLPACLNNNNCVACRVNSQCTGGKECTNNNSCACPANKPYIVNGQCVECDTANDCSDSDKICSANKTCEICRAGTTVNKTANRCDPIACTGGKVLVGSECQCPSGQQYYSGINRCAAPVSCTGGTVSSSNTCQCPPGQQYYSGINRCAAPVSCTGGTVTSSNTCQCPPDKVEVKGQCQVCNPLTNNGCDGLEPYCINNGTDCSSCVSLGKPVDNGCADRTPACLNNSSCVGCLRDAQCAGGQQCNLTSHSCVCPADKPYFVNGQCVECPAGKIYVNGQCVVCETGSNRGCSGNQECLNGTSCVGCVTTAHCTGHVCKSNQCVACTDNSECTDGGRTTCGSDGVCGRCQASGPYECKKSNQICKQNTTTTFWECTECPSGTYKKDGSSCVDCLNDSHCGTNEQCNLASNTCEAVTPTPACTSNSDCTTAPQVICKIDSQNSANNACVICTEDSHCAANQQCNTTDGTCFEPACLQNSQCQACSPISGCKLPCRYCIMNPSGNACSSNRCTVVNTP